MAAVSFRRHAPPATRAKAKGAKSKRAFVPRVIDGGKGAFLAGLGDCAAPRVLVKGAADAVEAALLFIESASAGFETGQVCVAVLDCETGVSHCFRLDFSDGTVPAI
jgi:Family of unknown function (DUF5961)